VFIVYAIVGAMSIGALSPDGPQSDQQRQLSSLRHEMEAVFLLPSRWVLGEAGASVFMSWAVWSILLFFLVYGLLRLVYGAKKRVG